MTWDYLVTPRHYLQVAIVRKNSCILKISKAVLLNHLEAISP